LHGRDHCLHADERPEGVDPEYPFDVVGSLLEKRAGVMDCRVVDEAIESPMTPEDGFDQGRPGSGVAHIGDDVDLSGDVGGHHIPPA
jgi:hypothetical protein